MDPDSRPQLVFIEVETADGEKVSMTIGQDIIAGVEFDIDEDVLRAMALQKNPMTPREEARAQLKAKWKAEDLDDGSVFQP